MSETTVSDELLKGHEVPGLGLPRETMLAMAMSARGLAGALRQRREDRGRAAWSEDNEAARIQLAADANSIDRLTQAQAAEWNERVATGQVGLWSEGRPGGLVLSDATLSDGAHIMQATIDNRTVTVASGSGDTAAHLREWLIANPSHDSLIDLRAAANEVADARTRTPDARLMSREEMGLYEAHKAKEAEAAKKGLWAEETVAEAERRATMEDRYQRSANYWASRDSKAQPDSESADPSHALRDRLNGRVPDEVFADRRWPMAERQYADLVARGTDPDKLVDAAAGLKFDRKVRTPAGLVAWQMRKAAQGQTEPTSEDQARREAATEWLAGATDSPTDRARASTLVGQIDSDFDQTLAQKYSGILTPDPEGQWHDHNGRAKSEVDRSRDAELSADDLDRADDESLAVMHGPVEDGDSARSQSVDHDHHAADERQQMSAAESARAHDAASPTQAERAAAAPTARATQPSVRSRTPQQRPRPTTARSATQAPRQARPRTP